ncbi:MAG: rhodanese-like domain-containing protein [Sedimenticolaceae bacterium]
MDRPHTRLERACRDRAIVHRVCAERPSEQPPAVAIAAIAKAHLLGGHHSPERFGFLELLLYMFRIVGIFNVPYIQPTRAEQQERLVGGKMNNEFMQISPMDLTRRLKGDSKGTVLDVRSPAEYRAGHIPGARLLPLDELKASNLADSVDDAGREADNPLYLTCHAGQRAEKAAQVLREAGLEHLTLVQGGTEAWQQAGLPLNKCGTALSLERQVQIAVGSLLILKVFFGFTVHELFFVAGAAIGAGLIAAGITRWCGMAQVLARMPWNRRRDCGHQAQAGLTAHPNASS